MDGDQGVEDSWDFFDTQPTSPGKEVRDAPQSSAKPPVKPHSAKPRRPAKNDDYSDSDKEEGKGGKFKGGMSRSPSGSSRSCSNSYSSYSDSETDFKNYRKKDGRMLKNSSKSATESDQSRNRSRSCSRSSRSRSCSHSDTETRTRSVPREEDHSTKPVAKAERALPHMGRSWQGEEEYSSSAYSDGEEDDCNKNNSQTSDSDRRRGVKKGEKRQAWGGSVPQDSIKVPTTGSRPKTAKGGRGAVAQRHRSQSQSEDSEALSDSDMTDVSPMDSPRHAKVKQAPSAGRELGNVQYRAMPIPDGDPDQEDVVVDNDHQTNGLDLEILMKAVSELEKQKRLQENSRRVMFAPMTLKRSEKSNYTFDKTKSRDIEKENQRLLREIVRRVNKTSEKKKPVQPPQYKLTASAINREREMKRIESENLAFLRRLQKVKPTKAICRDNQLRAYNSTTLHGVPMAALHPMPKGQRSAYEEGTSSIGSRTRSLSSINSVISTVRSGQSSRQGSRPSSATKRIDSRPQWNDRW